MSELEDRRQRAREAFSDDLLADVDNEAIDQVHHAVESAIETATRVRITDAAIQAMTGMRDPVTPGSAAWRSRRRELERALTALGFEVEP